MAGIPDSNYFFDTYALVEFYNGSANYEKFLGRKFFTTKLNLLEFYYQLLSRGLREDAESAFLTFSPNCIFVTDDVLKKAAEFRLAFNSKKRSRTSFIDAIGYVIARENGLKFVTGDDAFKNVGGVEFVK